MFYQTICSKKYQTSTLFSYENYKWKKTSINCTFNQSSDSDFQNIMNLYKKCTAKQYSFLVTDTILAPDNSSRFRTNFLERM